jgi:tRNA(Ile)-lysidine synthetase-like protein
VAPLSHWRLVAPHHPALPLVVRPPRRGDRIAVGSGSKEVRRALAEAGVPPGERGAWPVVEAGGEVVWIPGVRRAPGWPGPDGDRYLSASVEEETEWRT